MERIEDNGYRQNDYTVSDNLKIEDLPFLNYVYDKIVSIEFPASAVLLSVLRSKLESEIAFFHQILEMDVSSARELMGIGEVSAKEVNRMCDMMRRIASNPQTRVVFENSKKAELLAPRIEKKVEGFDIRTFHAYQNLMELCNGSVLNLYLRVVGLPPYRIKIPGLNTKKSQALFKFLEDQLPEIDKFISHSSETSDAIHSPSTVTESVPSLLYHPGLYKFDFSDEELERIVSTNNRIGHFPLFTFIACLFERMEDRAKEITQRTLNIIFGNSVEELSTVASSLNLSRERVRQLRDKCLKEVLSFPRIISRFGLADNYLYKTQSEYDFKLIREEEKVFFSNEYISICVSITNSSLYLIGDYRDSLQKPSSPANRLYLVSKDLNEIFHFEKFIKQVDEMSKEKRFYPYREDLETFVRNLLNIELSDTDFYSIVKECRLILLKGYPDNIINSQIFFPVNARKTIPFLIEDILREFNRPMTAEEICKQLNERYPDLEQIPSKIGPNALRNSNIVAVSRSSTYALVEWNNTEKRGGTIRDLAAEYLNSLYKPIAPLSDICDYIASFREDVKESSVKANLLAESSKRFSLYYKDDVMYIGFSDYPFDDEYVLQEKRIERRSFKESIDRLEQFIKENNRFPYTTGVGSEEIRLSRFYNTVKNNQKKGILTDEEAAEVEHINTTYGHLKVKKGPVSWEDRLERFVKHITENESLPAPSSKEYTWYKENKALYDAGELAQDRKLSFSLLLKIVSRMEVS